jgi:uncharacterized peroxidase-related enzyme
MDRQARPSPRLEPLPVDHSSELKEHFEAVGKNLGFVPDSVLIMQRKPKMVKAFAQMAPVVWDPDSKVDLGFKRLVAHVASRVAGCQYCMAHTIEGAAYLGVDEKKLAAVWEYQSSPLFTVAERVALDFAVAASVVPNEVTDASFEDLRKHWSEEQIVEIVATIAMFGFLNRWNDTMGTPIEDKAMAAGDKYLARGGWAPGTPLEVRERLANSDARARRRRRIVKWSRALRRAGWRGACKVVGDAAP